MALTVWRNDAWRLQIVKRSDTAGFEVLPKRWIVERTFAWISGNRRQAREDFERHNRCCIRSARNDPHHAQATCCNPLLMNLISGWALTDSKEAITETISRLRSSVNQSTSRCRLVVKVPKLRTGSTVRSAHSDAPSAANLGLCCRPAYSVSSQTLLLRDGRAGLRCRSIS